MADLSVYRNQVTLGQRVDENRQKRREREMLEDKFQQGKQEFEMKKQEAALKQQQALLNPFEGTGFDQQVANLAFQDAVRQGMNREDAQKYAADRVLGSKNSYSTDPVTGALITRPRGTVFGTPSTVGGGVSGSATGEGGYATPTLVAGPSQGELLEPPMLDGAMPQPEAKAPARTPVVPQGARAGAIDQKSLYQLADKTAGVTPAVVDFIGQTLGQLSPSFVNQEVAAARQTSTTAANDLIRSLSLNPRFPVGEIERLAKEINITPSMMDSPAAVRARMVSIDASLRNRLNNEVRAANNTTLPVETRKAALQAANDIRNFLAILGADEASRMQQAPAAVGGRTGDPLIDKYLE